MNLQFNKPAPKKEEGKQEDKKLEEK